MLRAAIVLLTVALTAAECDRKPAENVPRTDLVPAPAAESQRSTEAPIVAKAAPPAPSPVAAAAGRCVEPTSAQAPPSVAAAPDYACPNDPEGGPGNLPVVRVAFSDVSGVAVDAELARSEHDTMRGLMYRRSLGEERGMLFDMRFRGDHKFWMHNTCIPLDLLYLDEDGLIVGIVENAPTLDDQSRGVRCPSRWVLEVNAGWARRHGVRAGQRVNLPYEVRGS